MTENDYLKYLGTYTALKIWLEDNCPGDDGYDNIKKNHDYLKADLSKHRQENGL